MDNALKLNGSVVYWSLAEYVNRQTLWDCWDGLRYGSAVPGARSPGACLLSALSDAVGMKTLPWVRRQSGARWLIRPTRDVGHYEIVREVRGQGRNSYLHEYLVWIDETNSIFVDPVTNDGLILQEEVIRLFNSHLGLLTRGSVSSALGNLALGLKGVQLKPSTAFYWLPESALEIWKALTTGVVEASVGKSCQFYRLQPAMDEESVRAVRDAISRQFLTRAREIEEEIVGGTLGQRALAARKMELGEMRDRVAVYEGLLSVGLDDLRSALESIEQGSAAGELLDSALAGV